MVRAKEWLMRRLNSARSRGDLLADEEFLGSGRLASEKPMLGLASRAKILYSNEFHPAAQGLQLVNALTPTTEGSLCWNVCLGHCNCPSDSLAKYVDSYQIYAASKALNQPSLRIDSIGATGLFQAIGTGTFIQERFHVGREGGKPTEPVKRFRSRSLDPSAWLASTGLRVARRLKLALWDQHFMQFGTCFERARP